LKKILMLAVLALPAQAALAAQSAAASQRPEGGRPASLRFFGSTTAELFTRELDASFAGVLQYNFVAEAGNGFPAGFANASLQGHPWAGTMWSRDGGTFMRELVMRGDFRDASLLAECLIRQVRKTPDGFYGFPRYFDHAEPGSGTELDGTASIVIGMTLLWERLPGGDPTKRDIEQFLFQPASPINGFRFALSKAPLLAGSGEFGCGDAVRLCDNVVQNNLAMLALLATARMAGELGRPGLAREYTRLARSLRAAMEKYLVASDGSWIWCIDPQTLRPVPAILAEQVNLGNGSQNGVASMFADVLGFTPERSKWADNDHNEKTFERLYNTPLRRTEFDRYGIWTQFDLLAGGLLTSPSYGQGYALQTMLLYDKLAMASRALDWLANGTYKPVPEYKLRRSSPYFFYERMYSPDAVGKVRLDEGCGALNLVNVSEPLKVSRLMLGVDDSTSAYVRLIPRIPAGWQGLKARNWPILTRRGVVRADILFTQKNGGAELSVKLAPGEQIGDLKVRLPSSHGYVWREARDVREARLVSQ
jgi:hypothetical protein